MTRAKICGITRLEDAQLAVDLGAWAIGLILWPASPRACDPAVAAGIVRAIRRRVQTVGVFVNPTLDDVANAAEAIGLTHVQLHGDEGPAFCDAVAARTGCRVIKAVRIGGLADVREIERFHHVECHLLDSAVRGMRGGSGQPWDWALVAQRHSRVPALLSGGLGPENVGDGIAAVRPWGVDVASGVEAAPGIKDPERLAAFMTAVAAADTPAEVPG